MHTGHAKIYYIISECIDKLVLYGYIIYGWWFHVSMSFLSVPGMTASGPHGIILDDVIRSGFMGIMIEI